MDNIYNPKIVLWDIETSLMQVSTFSLYPKYIPHDAIIKDWSILCACWKVLGEDKIHSVSVTDKPKRFKKDVYDDYYVVKKLREMLSDVDILIHHNGDRFDLKKFNARLIYHNLPPLPKIQTIDTLKVARKLAKFTSSRLDYLGKYFGVDGKLETSKGLWEKAMYGDKEAIEEMVVYNKQDVKLLEDVYLKLRPYMDNHPNIADPATLQCPKCKSHSMIKHKLRVSASGIRRQQYQCTGCGGYFTDRRSEKEKPLSK